MYPGMLYWWKARQGGADCGAWAGCGPGFAYHRRERAELHAHFASDEELGAKVVACATLLLPRDAADRALTLLARVDEVIE